MSAFFRRSMKSVMLVGSSGSQISSMRPGDKPEQRVQILVSSVMFNRLDRRVTFAKYRDQSCFPCCSGVRMRGAVSFGSGYPMVAFRVSVSSRTVLYVVPVPRACSNAYLVRRESA